MNPGLLYVISFIAALLIATALVPVCRGAALRWGILDHPHSAIKTHKQPIPYLGGLAIASGVFLTLTSIRLWTDFPTGTLRSLRGIYYGAFIVVLLGLIDDIRPKGLGYRFKFIVQVVAALCLVFFDIRIAFVRPMWFAHVLTIVWVVGVMNAFNIIDIMDGLASGVALIASLGFLFIAFPSEAIYVNFAAAALSGALLGFLPFNLSKSRKIFMGDTGSLLVGYFLAALSLGVSYTQVNNVGVLAPILLLGVPIYDTFLVMVLRLRKGMSPFLGSKDHYALRLERWGLYREEILVLSYASSLALVFLAYQVTTVVFEYAVVIYAVVATLAVSLGLWLSRIRIDD